MNAPRVSLVIALSLLLPSAAPAATPAVDFDAGVDASAVLAAAKEGAKSVAAPAGAQVVRAKSFRRYDTDCVTVTFAPDASPTSERFHLESREWVEECYQTGDPRHGGGRQCYERPGYTHRSSAQVSLRDRQALLPWEYDAFRVCLTGPWLDIDAVETAYEYKLVQGGGSYGSYVLAPVKKIPMRPDPVGVLGELSPSMNATFKDKWASYYAGETVEIKYALKKHVEGWFDTLVAEGTLSAAAAETYALDLSKAGKLETGKKYYLEYQVRRVGAISKDSFTKKLETAKASYAPAALAFAR